MNSPIRKHADFMIYAMVVTVVIVVGVVVGKIYDQRYLHELRFSLIEKGNTLRAQLERELIAKITMSRGLVASIAASPTLSQERFSVIAHQLTRNNPDVLNIAAAPDLVIEYVYPLGKNSTILGNDYRSLDTQFEAVDMARKTRRTVMAGPINLLQGGTGLITRSPVYVVDPLGVERFWGIVSVVFDMPTFLEKAGIIDQDAAIEIAIRGANSKGPAGAMIYGDADVFSANAVLHQVTLPVGSWQVALRPKGGWPIHAKNYRLIWLLVIAFGLVTLSAAIVLRKHKRSREFAEKQLAQAIEAIDGGFSLFDPDDRLVMWNSGFRSISQEFGHILKPGVTYEELVRAAVEHGQYPESAGQEEAWIAKRLADHKSANSEEIHEFGEGRWLKIAERKLPDGSTVGLRVDVTELKRARDAAEIASKAKTDFLNNISHELRTPLTVILGYSAFMTRLEQLTSYQQLMSAIDESDLDAETLRQKTDSLSSEVSKYATQVEASGQHLLKMINDILDIARIEEGKLNLDRRLISVDAIVKSVADQFAQCAAAKNIEIRTETSGETVFADEVRLRQTLYNLVGNAVKFTEAGEINITTHADGAFVWFSIQDTGPGIAPEDQAVLFRRFMQVDRSDTRLAPGAGLGLAISKHLVELHGGEINLESTVGVGSKFSFAIPLHQAPGASA